MSYFGVTVSPIGSVNAPLSISSRVLSISQAGVATDGYLSSIDWNTFNNKLDTELDPVFSASPAAMIPAPGAGDDGKYLKYDHGTTSMIWAVAGGAESDPNSLHLNGDNQMASHIKFSSDNSYDIGASGANRPRTGYFGTSLIVNNATIKSPENTSFYAGYLAGNSITSGVGNAVLGSEALYFGGSSSYNIAIGRRALYNGQFSYNIAIGDEAALNSNASSGNIAIGRSALWINYGQQNIGIGTSALAHTAGSPTGTYNIGIGYNAGGVYYSQTIAIGFQALGGKGAQNYNIALGSSAGMYTQGIANVFIGAFTADLTNPGAGDYNVGIGYATLRTLSTGDNGNVALGPNAGRYATGSNKFYLNNQNRSTENGDETESLLYGVFDATVTNQRLTINAGMSNFNGAYKSTKYEVSLTADDQVVSVTEKSFVVLSSDDATPANRTFTLSGGEAGQRLVLMWSGANAGELIDTGTAKLSADWTPGEFDTLSLIFDGTNWVELGRSNN